MGSHTHNGEAEGFGHAVAGQLRARHPFHTAKLVARDLSCTVKAAENLLSGHLSAKSITRLVRAYGLDFLIDTGAALTGTTLHAHITSKMEKARDEQLKWGAELAALEEGLAHSRRSHGGHVGGPA